MEGTVIMIQKIPQKLINKKLKELKSQYNALNSNASTLEDYVNFSKTMNFLTGGGDFFQGLLQRRGFSGWDQFYFCYKLDQDNVDVRMILAGIKGAYNGIYNTLK